MEVLASRTLIRCRELARARRFYEEVLGLAVAREYGRAGEVTGVVLFTGNGLLELTSGGEKGGAGDPAGGVVLWLQVRDVRAEEEQLRSVGVAIEHATRRMPWGLDECWIRDPDGIPIVLVEVPDRHPLRWRVD